MHHREILDCNLRVPTELRMILNLLPTSDESANFVW